MPTGLSEESLQLIFFSLIPQLTWGTPTGKREECSFKGKDLEVRWTCFLSFLSVISLLSLEDKTSSELTNLFHQLQNRFIKCVGPPGNCSSSHTAARCLLFTMLSCQQLYPLVTNLNVTAVYNWYYRVRHFFSTKCQRIAEILNNGIEVLTYCVHKRQYFRFLGAFQTNQHYYLVFYSLH